MEKVNLHIPELKSSFSSQKFFRKADLRDFYRARSGELSEKTFRRILYALVRRHLILRVDAGVYTLDNGQDRSQSLKKFIPAFSPELRELNISVKAAFPYAEYLLWETRALHELMLHQPGRNQIILEVEKEVAESVFNFLNIHYPGKAFLQPDRVTFERYILPYSVSMIVTAMLTQSPHHKVEDILTPKLEKILVDIFADDEIFYVFHGEELVNIFKTAFHRYQISQKAIFRYAKRRKIYRKIRMFIEQKTDIILIQREEFGP
jgi:hypothetical protein